MKFRFLNKTFENRQFDYSPRYYDARKERLERKKVQYRKLENNELSSEERRLIFRDNMREECDGLKNLRISIDPLPPRILGGLMKIERSEVTLSFSGYSPAEEEAFLAQFDRAYQRGGG